MVHNGPIREAFGVAQIAQVVAVAPHLVLQLWVRDGGASDVVICGCVVLWQTPRQVSNVLVHLLSHARGHASSARYQGRASITVMS